MALSSLFPGGNSNTASIGVLSSLWLSVGNVFSWGIGTFLVGVLSYLFPLSQLPNFISWAVALLVHILQPLFQDTSVSQYVNALAGANFRAICTIASYFIGILVPWSVFYWVVTGCWWWWCYCVCCKLVLWGYHQFWGSQ